MVGVLSRRDISGASVGLTWGDICHFCCGGHWVSNQNQLNLVDTSVEGASLCGEVVLEGGRGDSHLEVDAVAVFKRDASDARGTADVVETSRGGIGDLAQQHTGEVGRGSSCVGAVLVRSSAGKSSSGLVDSVERSVNCQTSSGTLLNEVGEQSVFIAKQINTVGGVKERLGKVANKVVLDEVLLGDDFASSWQHGMGNQSVSVSGVQLQGCGPCVHVHVVLDIGSIGVVDIKRVSLILKDILHMSSLNVEDGDAACVDSGGSLTSESTGEIERKCLVKAFEGKVHHNCLL